MPKKKASPSLQSQCESLGVELIESQAPDVTNVELAALKLIRKTGWDVTHCEGSSLFWALKALAAPTLRGLFERKFGDFSDINRQSFKSQLLLFEPWAHAICSDASECSPSNFQKNLEWIYSIPSLSGRSTNGPSIEISSILFDVYGAEHLAMTFHRMFKAGWGAGIGWPDLIAHKYGVVRFVEVKKQDRLLDSQIFTINRVLKPSGFDVAVLKMSKGGTST